MASYHRDGVFCGAAKYETQKEPNIMDQINKMQKKENKSNEKDDFMKERVSAAVQFLLQHVCRATSVRGS